MSPEQLRKGVGVARIPVTAQPQSLSIIHFILHLPPVAISHQRSSQTALPGSYQTLRSLPTLEIPTTLSLGIPPGLGVLKRLNDSPQQRIPGAGLGGGGR